MALISIPSIDAAQERLNAAEDAFADDPNPDTKKELAAARNALAAEKARWSSAAAVAKYIEAN